MKKNPFIVWIACSMLLAFSACRKSDIVVRKTQNELSDIYATVAGRVNERLVTPVYSANRDTIYFDIPWYYPVNSDNEIDITRMLVKATIPTDARVSPSFEPEIDLTNPYKFTVTAGDGSQSEYVIVSRKVGDVTVTVPNIRFTVDGAEQEIEGVVNGTNIYFYVLPGLDVSNVEFTYELNRRSSGSVAYGSSINLSQPVPFTVTGVGNTTRTYSLIATEPTKLDYGVGIHRKLWTKTAAELGFSSGNETSIAVSGDFLVLGGQAGPTYRVFNRFTGAYVKNMHVAIAGSAMQLVNDDAGHLLATSYAGTGDKFVAYLYQNVDDAAPVKLIDFTNNTPPLGGWIGALGRAVNIYGDLTGDAVITATGAFTNVFQRWVVKNGALVSQTPETVTYGSTDNMGVWAEVQPISTSANADYFVAYQSEVALVNGMTNQRSRAFSLGWPVVYLRPAAYARFNNANYLAVVKYINSYDLNQVRLSLFDVTQTTRISMPESDPDYGSLQVFSSDLLVANGGGTTGDVCIGTSENGERMQVYMMLTNGGILVREFTTYAP